MRDGRDAHVGDVRDGCDVRDVRGGRDVRDVRDGCDVRDGYDGPATLLLDGAELAVTVHLRGRFEPIDGRYHWYGRIGASQALAAALPGGRGAATLRTPHGEAGGQLGDPDTWGRYRIDGVRTPPFPVSTGLPG